MVILCVGRLLKNMSKAEKKTKKELKIVTDCGEELTDEQREKRLKVAQTVLPNCASDPL